MIFATRRSWLEAAFVHEEVETGAAIAQTMKAGFQFHLTKPVEAQKLYQAIERIPTAFA